MKLRNKNDGRVREFGIDETKSFPYYLRDELGNTYWAKTIKEIADKWEEIEEPKEFWCINTNFDDGVQRCWRNDRNTFCPDDVYLINTETIYNLKMFGNYFETKEEAELAVEKLRAWKRLKDSGFEFVELRAPNYGSSSIITIKANCLWNSKNIDDLKICFGGEE